jgi:hypothetical protein
MLLDEIAAASRNEDWYENQAGSSKASTGGKSANELDNC